MISYDDYDEVIRKQRAYNLNFYTRSRICREIVRLFKLMSPFYYEQLLLTAKKNLKHRGLRYKMKKIKPEPPKTL